ncbi:MAG TPA: hypothetical protein VFE62_20630 [Gemmataceae bacterium]|nr:hypothetical protein [Gemmataceae bacterium]
MLILLLILIITLVSLIVLLWAGTVFFQGYFYTEPTPGIYWQAPVTAAVLTFGFAIWCFSVAFSSGASPTNIPINTIFSFVTKEDMMKRPAKNLWAIKADPKKTGADRDGETVAYVSEHLPDRLNTEKFQYKDPITNRPYQWQGVIALEIQPDPNDPAKMRFDLVETGTGRYRQFVSRDGWVIEEFETGPLGIPSKFRVGRFIWNILFNVGHFVAWFVCLWLVLRFQWPHALGFAVVLWLVTTLVILPMMLGYAGQVSESRRAPVTPGVALVSPRGQLL